VPPGKILAGAGSMLSWKQCLQIWCQTQGLTYGGFDEISIEEFVQNSQMGPDLGLELAEMFALMDSPGYNGGDPRVLLPEKVCSPFCLGPKRILAYWNLAGRRVPIKFV
jgi:hypothetical protein